MTAMAAELKEFLERYPDVEVVDCMMPDMCGALRGKQIPASALKKLYTVGIPLPTSTALMDSKGQLVDTVTEGPQDGDPDRMCRPVPGTLSIVPWAGRPTAQVMMSQHNRDGSMFIADPRAVLLKTLEPITAMGLKPVVAVELEFYLTEPDLPLRPAQHPHKWPAMTGAQATGFEDLYDFEDFINEVLAVSNEQGLPAASVLSEYGPGQFEVNLNHTDDVAAACDHAVLLKRTIKGIARRRGKIATFMAKPYAEAEGSGLHVHMSLLDKDGRNIFSDGSDTKWAKALEHAIAGQQATMADAMAIFAPNANSYRRFRRGGYVPLTPRWGVNHRGVPLRIPISDAANMRFEHRVSGADANPFLVVAAILAGVHHGLTGKLEPVDFVPEAGVITEEKVSLPLRWNEALDIFEGSKLMRAYLGETYHRYYTLCRRFEEESFQAEVSDRDFDWYLRSV